MSGADWGEILSAFIACAIKPGLVGLPASVFAFNFPFLETLLVSGSAGICGSIVFGFLSKEVIVGWEWVLKKIFPNRQKRTFTKMNRFIIRAKKYFGITGIAIISPLILSIPLGTFLAIRFFKDRHKTVLYMSISSVVWTVALYFLYNGLYDKLKSFFT